jgi:hypothetical protein
MNQFILVLCWFHTWEAVPTTIHRWDSPTTQGGIASINYSSNPLSPPICNLSRLLAGCYNHIIPSDSFIPTTEIIEARENKALVISCDGSYNPTNGRATFSWIFSHQMAVNKGTGTILDNSSPYRAELHAILASLVVLLRAKQACISGAVTALLICDC